jgi:integrase
MTTKMKISWNRSAKQFYRELGKKNNGRAHRFYLGDNEDRAKSKMVILTEMWRALKSRWERWRDAGMAETEFPMWDETTLTIAQAISEGRWSVKVHVPPEIDSDGVAHWLVDLRATYPMIAISIDNEEAIAQVNQEMRTFGEAEAEREYKRHRNRITMLQKTFAGYGAKIRTNYTLHDALDSYIDFLKNKHRDVEGRTNQTGLKQSDRINRIKNNAPNLSLDDFQETQIRTIIEYWRTRPTSRLEKKYSPTTCHHTITAFRAFIQWLHRNPDFQWKKPPDFDFEKINIVRSNEEKHSRAFVRVFTREQIAILWNHATEFQRKIILLGLNCGFLRSEISHLDWSHINGNIIRNLRPKTGVVGEFMLWETTLKYLGERKPSGPVVTTKNGNSVASLTKSSNVSAIIPNSWNRLISRIQKSHPDFERLPVKHLRKTAAQMILQVSDGETAGVFLQHGRPVESDRELPAYANPVFERVFRAQKMVWENLKDIFTDNEPVDLPRKLSLVQIKQIRKEKRHGIKTKWLAGKFGVSEDTIRRVTRKNKR